MSALKDIMEGKPLRSPVHAAVVHFPLACFTVGTLLDVGSQFIRNPELHLVPAAFWALLAGVATALAAAVFGMVDYTSIRRDHPAKKSATLHMVLNVVALVAYGASLFARRDALLVDHTEPWALATSVGGYLILMVSGYIGGHLVYNEGVGVGRHRRRAPIPGETIELEAGGAPFVAVCRADELENGEIRRIRIQGTVMALAKTGERFFAVQEFCSHRFGPLSEGSIEDGNVMCPWHRSCFDLRTGKVAHGPAKVDLRTFPVELRDGMVCVQVPARATASGK